MPQFQRIVGYNRLRFGLGLGLCCLTPLTAIFQLYLGGKFNSWTKLEYPEKTTDLPQVTDKLVHIYNVLSITPGHEQDSNLQP